MKSRWTVGFLSAACFSMLLPAAVHGQQSLSAPWQGEKPPPFLQSPTSQSSSPQPKDISESQSPAGASDAQTTPMHGQPLGPQSQPRLDRPQVLELPVIEPQEQLSPRVAQPPVQTNQQQDAATVPATVNVPGYLGANTRNFYRQRFCMHALTIQGVEVETVLPNSPAAQAGLRPARPLTAREAAVATVAGLVTLTPAASVAPSLVRFGGGVNHGDIILAVNGRRVKTHDEFQSVLLGTRPQTTVYLTVHRNDTNTQIPVQMGEWPKTTEYVYFQ